MSGLFGDEQKPLQPWQTGAEPAPRDSHAGLDRSYAREAREEAIDRVEEHASAAFMSMARAAALRVARVSPFGFTADDVWAVVSKDTTHEPKAMGSVMRSLHRDGAIVRTDRTRVSESATCNARPMRIWLHPDYATTASIELALGKFFRWTCRKAWEGFEPDGADIQEKAIELGLLVREQFDPGRHDDPSGCAEPGDDFYTIKPEVPE